MTIIRNNAQPKKYITKYSNKEVDIEALNEKYKYLTPNQRLKQLYNEPWITNEEQVLLTSSFGTTSSILLHMVSRLPVEQKVYFLNTYYHFQETIEYKEDLTSLLNLNVIDLKPEGWKHEYSRVEALWSTDPDFCCSINKVEPLEPVKEKADVWISGLMHWQNENRKNLNVFEYKDGILKFYPLLDVEEEEAYAYMDSHQLPAHPLKDEGYESIGCFHCTFKGKGRQGRWPSMSKTECGLHA